jgi:endonuclease G
MINRINAFTIILLVTVFCSCETTSYLHRSVTSKESASAKSVLLKHDCITIGYDIEAKQASWVAYTLKKTDLEGDAKRKNNFKRDPLLSENKSASDEDYYKSGFDRGHLAPAADMTVSQNCMDQSFYYSNISPQLPGHNRGVWKRLESDVRDWAIRYDSVVVVTGAIIDRENDERLGDSKMCVPKRYYKALLIKTDSAVCTIGFIVDNESSKDEINTFSVTIDELEDKTDLDFFPILSKEEQAIVESKIDYNIWFEMSQ